MSISGYSAEQRGIEGTVRGGKSLPRGVPRTACHVRIPPDTYIATTRSSHPSLYPLTYRRHGLCRLTRRINDRNRDQRDGISTSSRTISGCLIRPTGRAETQQRDKRHGIILRGPLGYLHRRKVGVRIIFVGNVMPRPNDQCLFRARETVCIG